VPKNQAINQGGSIQINGVFVKYYSEKPKSIIVEQVFTRKEENIYNTDEKA
jgi:hypothetical protein